MFQGLNIGTTATFAKLMYGLHDLYGHGRESIYIYTSGILRNTQTTILLVSVLPVLFVPANSSP